MEDTETEVSENQSATAEEAHTVEIAEMAVAGTVVVVESDDEEEAYYLFRVSKGQYPLSSLEVIGGVDQIEGTMVLEGEWLDRIRKGYSYELLKGELKVTVDSVRMVLVGTDWDMSNRRKLVYRISESIHEDIMGMLIT